MRFYLYIKNIELWFIIYDIGPPYRIWRIWNRCTRNSSQRDPSQCRIYKSTPLEGRFILYLKKSWQKTFSIDIEVPFSITRWWLALIGFAYTDSRVLIKFFWSLSANELIVIIPINISQKGSSSYSSFKTSFKIYDFNINYKGCDQTLKFGKKNYEWNCKKVN